MAFNNMRVETEGGLATITISRPKALNALNAETITELKQVFTELEHDDMTRVVIITGEGDKAFVAGADISELKKADMFAARQISERGHKVLSQIETSDLISIAAVNGFALGGGCELAMACDIRYAADTAKLGQPEVNLGVIPGYGGTQRLPRLVGRGKALELLLSGNMVSGEEAMGIGLVDAVFPAAELMQKAKKLAGKILSKGPLATVAVKSCVRQGLESSLTAGCALETSEFSAICASEDKNEGMTAFLEKRSPDFTGK
jgi:enoyl-CoA hydratase